MQRQYPVVKDAANYKDHLVAPMAQVLPSSANLSQWLGPVKDQGQLGACTGFAFAGLREFLCRKFPDLHDDPTAVLSPMFLYYEERAAEGDVDQDGGAQSRTGMRTLAKLGICREATDPYSPKDFKTAPTTEQLMEALSFRIGAYHRVLNLNTLRSVLASGYVSSLAIQVYESFESDAVATTGTVPVPQPGEQSLGGHEVLAYGYDDINRRVLVRNSWGTAWGKEGNFVLPYEYFHGDLVMDMWTGHLGKPW